MPKKLLVSACLCGTKCRYDGGSSETLPVRNFITEWAINGGEIVAVCPEELGELSTPRPPSQLKGGSGADIWRDSPKAIVERVSDSEEVTGAFRAGAEAAANKGKGADLAILKARSPSCGVGKVWCEGELISGDGVFAALLRSKGVNLLSDEEI